MDEFELSYLGKIDEGAVGDVKARNLIEWFNKGADGKIRWGTPGDFDSCVSIAAKHMPLAKAKGFCANRHHNVTGEWPGPDAHKSEGTQMTGMAYGWAPITKVEEQPDGTVIVHGPMSSTALDRDQQRFSQGFLDQAVPQWFNESGNIREQHDPKRAVGNALQVKRDDATGVWDLAAHVVDPVAVTKVRNKVLKGFSIGVKQPHVTYGKADSPGGEIDGGIICETSVVDRPSNPMTVFQVVKSDGDGDDLVFEPGDGMMVELLEQSQIEKSWSEALHPRGPGGKFHKGETVVSEHGGKTIMGLHAGSSPSNQGRVTITQVGEGGAVQHHSVPRESIRRPLPHELPQARQHTGGDPGPTAREVSNPHHVGKQVRLNSGKTGTVVEADPHTHGMSRVQFDDDKQTRYVPNKLMKARDGATGTATPAQRHKQIARVFDRSFEDTGYPTEAIDQIVALPNPSREQVTQIFEQSFEDTGYPVNAVDRVMKILGKADGDEFEGSDDVDPTEGTDPADEADGEDDEMANDPRVDALIERIETLTELVIKHDEAITATPDEPDLTKVDQPGLIKAAVAEVTSAIEGRLATIEADLTKALAMPEPGGPVQMRTSGQATLAQAKESANVRAEIDDLLSKADHFRQSDRTASEGYEERANRLKRTLNG